MSELDPKALVRAIAPDLKAAEQRRQDYQRTLWITGSLCALFGLGLAFLFFPLAILPVIVWSMTYKSVRHRYADEYKQLVVGGLVQQLDAELHYEPHRYVDPDAFFHSRLFGGFSRSHYKGEDLVYGRLDGRRLAFSDLTVMRHGDSDFHFDDHHHHHHHDHHHEHDSVLFKGLFIAADAPERLRGYVLVLPDTAERLLGGLGSKLQNMARRGLVYFKEDPAFERDFVVYASDEADARRLLTPELRDRLCALRHATHQKTYVSFVSDQVYIAVANTEGIYEPSLGAPANDPKQLNGYAKQVARVFHYLNALGLDMALPQPVRQVDA